MTTILATRSAEARTKGEALIRTADKLLCESWNVRMWADGEPMDPSPAINQAINGGYGWLEIECLRCKSRRNVDLAALPHPRRLSFMRWPAATLQRARQAPEM